MLKFTLVRNNSRARGYLSETIFCRGELPALRLLFFFSCCCYKINKTPSVLIDVLIRCFVI